MLRETLRLQESDMSPGLVMGETTRLCTQRPRAGQVRSNDMSGWQTEMKRRARGVMRKTMVQSNHFPPHSCEPHAGFLSDKTSDLWTVTGEDLS